MQKLEGLHRLLPAAAEHWCHPSAEMNLSELFHNLIRRWMGGAGGITEGGKRDLTQCAHSMYLFAPVVCCSYKNALQRMTSRMLFSVWHVYEVLKAFTYI